MPFQLDKYKEVSDQVRVWLHIRLCLKVCAQLIFMPYCLELYEEFSVQVRVHWLHSKRCREVQDPLLQNRHKVFLAKAACDTTLWLQVDKILLQATACIEPVPGDEAYLDMP